MISHSAAKFHQLLRQRVHQNLEAYPSPDKWKNLLDKAIYGIGLLGPLITVPQLMQVWSTQDVGGLSLLTWVTWIILDVLWILYGAVHKNLPIIVSHAAYMVVQAGVVAGILIYG